MKNLTFLKKILSVTLALSILMLSGCGGGDTKPSESGSESASSESSESSEPVELRDPVDLKEKLKGGIERNPDTVAWLNIPGMEVDDAILQMKNPAWDHQTNNSYYLRLDEDKKYDIFGCYWADAACNVTGARDGLSKNTIIYGHSDYKDNKDGKKFSKLFAYNDIDFLKEHPYIYLTTEDEEYVFQIFSVFYTHIDFVYIYADPTEEHFAEIIKGAQDRSEYITDVEVDPAKDKIITLSTCTGEFVKGDRNNYRYVVMGKLLPNTDVPAGAVEVKVNPNPLRD